MAKSSSSQSISTTIIQPHQYDVFISFRGEDVRSNFVSHLQSAFKRKGITTFFDEELNRGQQISPALLQALQQSSISLVVLSQNYASSKWCLDELLEILQCRNIYRQIVMPVFYHVDPSHVRKQMGSYAEAFRKHEETQKDRKDEIVQRWKDALTEVANLSGLDSANWRLESEMIDKISQEILKKLDRLTLNDVDGLVGIEHRVERIESSLCADSNDVRILGIWGMGGIGKTTVARTLFHKIKNQFDGYCFVENVRENSGKNGHGLPDLRKKLLAQVTEEKHLPMEISCAFLKKRMCGKKVLIILDDIDHIEQLENLVGKRDWFGVGSRIVITTRNRQLLTEADVVYNYATEQLTDKEALLLFSHHAFNSSHPPKVYLELSRKAINYACGIPLALKLLGSNLRKKDQKTWESALARLERFSDDEIVNRVLELSFEGLHPSEKHILLDIACFFKGEDVEFATSIWEVCGFFPNHGLSVLGDKCLISLTHNSQLWMHGLIQEMCKAVVRKENTEPGRRSRLWEPKDIFHIFKKNTGTSNIQCIILNLSETSDVLELSEDAFAKMEKLRLLKFISRELDGSMKIRLPRGLTMLPDSLRYLFWDHYPNKFLPSKFDAQNLVELSLRQSCINQLWKGYWMFKHSSICLKHLKRLNLFGCSNFSNFREISDTMEQLSELSLEGTGVSNLPSSIENLTGLATLDLRKCTKLVSLPNSICNLKHLKSLQLSGCSNFSNFPEISNNMEHLYKLSLSKTGVSNLPSSIENLNGLVRLNLYKCKKLVSLPDSICNLKCLRILRLGGCRNLQHLPENIGNLESLKCLSADKTSIKHVPSSIICLKNISDLSFRGCTGTKLSTSHGVFSWFSTTSCMGLQLPPLGGFQHLNSLFLNNCNLLEAPSGLHNLASLTLLDLSGNNFETLPQTIFYNLSRLRCLTLNYCTRLRSLPELPPSLLHLWANECTSLESFMSPLILYSGISRTNYKRLCFLNCWKLKNYQFNNMLESLEKGVYLGEKTERNYLCNEGYHPRLGFSLWAIFTGSEIPEWFSNQTVGSAITLHIPPHCLDKPLGFAVCLILSSNDTFVFPFSDIEIVLTYQVDGKSTYTTYSRIMCEIDDNFYFKDDHVFFGITLVYHELNRPKNCNYIECSVRLDVCSIVKNDYPIKIKKFAVQLVKMEEKTQPTFNSSSQSYSVASCQISPTMQEEGGKTETIEGRIGVGTTEAEETL